MNVSTQKGLHGFTGSYQSVRGFEAKMQPITSHTRLEKGSYTRVLGVGGCRGTVEQSVGYFRNGVYS